KLAICATRKNSNEKARKRSLFAKYPPSDRNGFSSANHLPVTAARLLRKRVLNRPALARTLVFEQFRRVCREVGAALRAPLQSAEQCSQCSRSERDPSRQRV